MLYVESALLRLVLVVVSENHTICQLSWNSIEAQETNLRKRFLI